MKMFARRRPGAAGCLRPRMSERPSEDPRGATPPDPPPKRRVATDRRCPDDDGWIGARRRCWVISPRRDRMLARAGSPRRRCAAAGEPRWLSRPDADVIRTSRAARSSLMLSSLVAATSRHRNAGPTARGAEPGEATYRSNRDKEAQPARMKTDSSKPCKRCAGSRSHRGELVAELGDLTRFGHPRQLMAYLGLVPSEHSSGPSVRRGGITKAGNPHVRRLLAEAAWAYQGIPRIGRQHAYRQEALPKVVCDIAWKAQLRLTTLPPARRAREGQTERSPPRSRAS